MTTADLAADLAAAIERADLSDSSANEAEAKLAAIAAFAAELGVESERIYLAAETAPARDYTRSLTQEALASHLAEIQAKLEELIGDLP